MQGDKEPNERRGELNGENDWYKGKGRRGCGWQEWKDLRSFDFALLSESHRFDVALGPAM